ncbi:MAG: hypothetical protein ABIJ36_00285 [Patescibacteria group bacterium]|nr:hypothetical protein [Patescibacteria group bacterium]
MIDYNIYENSTAILDRSGTAQIEYMCSNNVPAVAFLESKGITFAATQSSLAQLVYTDQPSLFTASPDLVTSNSETSQNFVISRTTGTITCDSYESGPKIDVLSSVSTPSGTFWDTTTSFRRLSKDAVDISNINAARSFANSHFVILNDKEQIKQLTFENKLYFRPVEILLWMYKDSCINSQQTVWMYKKMGVNDPRWIKKGTTFAKYKLCPR